MFTALNKLQDQLAAGCEQLSYTVTAEQQQQLIEYLLLIEKWSKSYNLSAIKKAPQMVVKHLLDSLVVAPFIQVTHCIDVGSGAGLPSIPLAIVLPNQEFISLDSNSKKTRFQTHALGVLGLSNITVVQERIEKFNPVTPQSAVLSRAFASLDKMVLGTQHLIAADGRWLAMKGRRPVDEIQALPPECYLVAEHQLSVPNLDEERWLIELAKA